MMFFWCQFGLGKCFGASSWSSHWASCLWLVYTVHFLFHITVQWYFKTTIFFLFVVSSWGAHLSSFFSFPICFKFHKTIERSTLSPLATCVVCKRISFEDCSQLVVVASDGWPLLSSSSRLLSPLQKLFEPPLHYTFIVVPGPNMLLMLRCDKFM